MTAKEMAALVGKRGTIEVVRAPGTLYVEVEVLDVRTLYGVVRYQVKPVAGSGIAWVTNITITEEVAS